MFFEANSVYHIYNRSNETLFYSRENYLYFLSKIKLSIFQVCNILAWVLMPNHFHLLVQATENSCINTTEKHRPDTQLLSKNIGIVLSSYTQAINRQQNRRGNLFAHKTKAKMLNEEYLNLSGGFNNLTGNKPDYTTTCFLYIHQNPVNAGLVAKLEDWEFSSFSDFAGLRNGKLINKQLAYEFTDLDPEHFCEQSNRLVDDELLRKLYP